MNRRRPRPSRPQRGPDHASEQLPATLGDNEEGRVVARFGEQADVERADRSVVRCAIRKTLARVVCGDHVQWKPFAQPQEELHGVIDGLQERRSLLQRPDPYDGLKPVAANIDCMVIVSAPQPAFSRLLLDRYLVASHYTRIAPLIIMNKSDLLNADGRQQLDRELAPYLQLGYRVLWVSANSGNGLEELHQQLRGITSVIVGQSGVGKSSLINCLHPQAALNTGALSSQSGLGQHTTTAARLFHLPCGGDLIDSPGVREFALWHLEPAAITAGFHEVAEAEMRCKFRNCSHRHEPGCAVLSDLEQGAIDPQRYANYLKIIDSLTIDRPRRHVQL